MPFKTCTMCFEEWTDRDEFISNPKISMLGYQACLKEPAEGIFLFNHEEHDCGSTIAIEVEKFLDLYNGPRYTEPKTDSSECSGYCHNTYDLEKCNAQCAYAYIREIIQILKSRCRQSLKANAQRPRH